MQREKLKTMNLIFWKRTFCFNDANEFCDLIELMHQKISRYKFSGISGSTLGCSTILRLVIIFHFKRGWALNRDAIFDKVILADFFEFTRGLGNQTFIPNNNLREFFLGNNDLV